MSEEPCLQPTFHAVQHERRKSLMNFLLPATGLAFLLLGLSTGLADDPAPAAKPPPLSLEGLLDEELPEAPIIITDSFVTNRSCYVCHGNYRGEELVTSHAKKDIGCITCHGESADHRNDENNITPPDIMFSGQYIDAMCSRCHEKHVALPRAILRRWQVRCATQDVNPREIVCTDCHFNHRLPFRTVRWDKTTRRLIPRQQPPQARQETESSWQASE